MYRFLQLSLGTLMRLVWRLRVDGADRMPAGGVVLVANHESVLDPLAAMTSRRLRSAVRAPQVPTRIRVLAWYSLINSCA